MKQNKEEKSMSIEELKTLIAEVKATKKKIDSLADALTDSSDDYISVCAGNDDLMADVYTFDQVRMNELTDAMDLLDMFVDGIESEFQDICTNAINDREIYDEDDCSPRALWLDSVQEDARSIMDVCSNTDKN